MNLISHKPRKPDSIKKIIKKIFFWFYNDNWDEMFKYIITQIANNVPDVLLKLFSKKKICSICQFKSYKFFHISNHRLITWNSACPNCDSRSRHRGLFFLYQNNILKDQNKKILHFAPELILSRRLINQKNNEYYTTDLFRKDVNYPNEDIQDLSFNDYSFDIILCNHVLEHVKNDIKGLEEIERILTKNGIAVITIPGNWKKRTKYFFSPDDNGHYRDYGFDIILKFRNIFSKVYVQELYRYQGQKYAIKKGEIAFVCIK